MKSLLIWAVDTVFAWCRSCLSKHHSKAKESASRLPL